MKGTATALSVISGNRMKTTSYNYSYRSESTGLAMAALTANHNTVKTAISDEASPENKK